MSKLIRRTITITMTETWTIVWLSDDDPLRHPTPTVQHQPETQEEANENLLATITATEPDKPSVRDPPATARTSATTLNPPSGGASINATISRKRKSSRGRRTEGN